MWLLRAQIRYFHDGMVWRRCLHTYKSGGGTRRLVLVVMSARDSQNIEGGERCLQWRATFVVTQSG